MILDAYFLNDKLETAVHEAGHAVLAYYSGATITSATIETHGIVGGLVQFAYAANMAPYIQDSIAAAGYVACVLYDGKYDMASESRRQRHSEQAAGDWAKLKGDAFQAVLHATRVLEDNWYRVEALAVALLDSLNHTLTGSQVTNVLRSARKPAPAVALPQPSAPSDWDVPADRPNRVRENARIARDEENRIRQDSQPVPVAVAARTSGGGVGVLLFLAVLALSIYGFAAGREHASSGSAQNTAARKTTATQTTVARTEGGQNAALAKLLEK